MLLDRKYRQASSISPTIDHSHSQYKAKKCGPNREVSTGKQLLVLKLSRYDQDERA